MKKFLIIVCAGDNSYHTKWFNSKKYDIYTVYFGSNNEIAEKYKNNSDFFVRRNGPKWQLIRYVLKNFTWQEYKYIWMPDDDLDITKKKVEEFLYISNKLNLNISQPSLRVPEITESHQIKTINDWKNKQKEAELNNSYMGWVEYYYNNKNPITEKISNHISYKILMQHYPRKQTAVRYTNFVEIMCPLIKSNIVKKIFKLIDNDSIQSGFYLDTIWLHMVKFRKVAVIDYIPVIHTRPVGIFQATKKLGNFNALTIDPKKEIRIIKRNYKKIIPNYYKKTLKTIFLSDKKKKSKKSKNINK